MSLPYADKNLGQHFLKDKSVINKICTDFIDDCDSIIEVGPGPGILTESLSKSEKDLYLFEKDNRFLEIIEKLTPIENIQMGDALEVDFNLFCETKGLKDNWLVSNLPYNVSVPLLIKFIQTPSIKKMTLMFQKEVAEKALNFSNKKNAMGSLMTLCQNYFEVELLCKVAPGAFLPPPKVDSAVLSFIRKENSPVPVEEFKSLESFLRLTFSQKRKQFSKVLSSRYPRESINKILEDKKIKIDIRAEKLTFDEIIEIYKSVKELAC